MILENYTMGRPKKILTLEEKEKLEQKLRIREFIKRVLGHLEFRQINWIVETSIVKSWFKKYPNQEFWDSFVLPEFLKEVTSLRPFSSNWGQEFIKKQYNIWIFNSQESAESIELGEKVAGDVQMDFKPKNLREFLD